MKYDDWRPKHWGKDETLYSTTVVADDEDNPTNWQTCKSWTFASLEPGTWKILYNFIWWMGTTTRRGMFRFLINGVPSRHTSEEPKDKRNIEGDSYMDIFDISVAGDLIIELQFLVGNGTGTVSLNVDKQLAFVEKIGD